jgi:hypothetical protein
MTPEKVVLLFAYHYPPENVIGAARPYRFQKYLSRLGYRCEVLTAADQSCCPNSCVTYVGDPFAASSRANLAWQAERGVRKLFFPGALGFHWSFLACRAARSLLSPEENAQVTIYSTFPPIGPHLAALSLVRNRRWKWIADFRDPLIHQMSDGRHHWLQSIAQSRLEKTILAKADAVVVSNDGLERRWRSTYPKLGDRISVIWNGYDPEDRIEERQLPERDFQLISHIGALYGGRCISPLLESVSRLVKTGRVARERIRIRLVGPVDRECLPSAKFLEQAKCDGWLEIIPHQVPQLEARGMAQESNALLLIQPHSTVQVPGKLFEYLRLKRPILAYILPGSPIEEILRRSGANYRCVYADASAEEIDSSLETFVKQKERSSETNAWFADKFNGRKQAEDLGKLIQSLHSPRTQVAQTPVRTVPQTND